MEEDTKTRVREFMLEKGKNALLSRKGRMDEFYEAALKKPFHVLFFPQNAIVVSQLERSLTRAIGQEFYTEIAKIVAEESYEDIHREYTIEGEIDIGMVRKLDDILEELDHGGRSPDKTSEMIEISGSGTGSFRKERTTADLYIGDYESGPLCLEFKTPWPKKEDCIRSKKRILLFELIKADEEAQAYVAFPYDPFESWEKWWWTAPKIFDRTEVRIAEETWDMLGGSGTFESLVSLAKNVGEGIREEVGLFKGLVEE